MDVKLKYLKNKPPHEIDIEKVLKTEREINPSLEWDKVMWKQRSRQFLLKHRDQDSRYFRSKENGRRIWNHVARLINEKQ